MSEKREATGSPVSKTVREIQRIFDALPPPPRFNRVAVRELSTFDSIPRVEYAHSGLASLGIPVVVDEDVDPGVVELRNGDEVVERLALWPTTGEPPGSPPTSLDVAGSENGGGV